MLFLEKCKNISHNKYVAIGTSYESISVLAAEYGVSTRTVSRQRKRFREATSGELWWDKKRSGRPRLLSPEEEELLRAEIHKRCRTREEWLAYFENRIQWKTLWAILKRLGAKKRSLKLVQKLSENDKHRILDWSRQYKDEHLDRVVFSDEQVFSISKGVCKITYGTKNAQPKKLEKSGHEWSLSCWGGISKNWKTPLVPYK